MVNILNRSDGYRILALTELGWVWPESLPVTAVAERRDIPAGYLSNLVGDLVRSGVLRSRRGPGGGLALSRAPDAIALSELVAVAPSGGAHADTVGRVEAAVANAVEASLGTLTVADLVGWERGESPEYSI